MKALVVGGNSGIGLAVVINLLLRDYEHIYIVGKNDVDISCVPEQYKTTLMERTSFKQVNLINEEYEFLKDVKDINTLIVTAGFGRVASFEDLTECEITNLIKCNELAVIRIIKSYYEKIRSENKFYCAVMGSIAGHVASPLFSVYGASKMGLCGFIENVNAELAAQNYENRILDVSPGAIGGTSFNGGKTDYSVLSDFANEIIDRMFLSKTLYIPKYDEVYGHVIKRYHQDSEKYALESFNYKKQSGRIHSCPQTVVGYLSGTFDLFHIGHLNLLKRAKNECDYLIVGVHKSGSWKGKETFISHDERMEIVRSIKYVDKVIESFPEDSDAYDVLRYNKLFVGSDYKGSERFSRYEEYFKDKNVEIVYFPYTDSTSSTQLRNAIKTAEND